MAIHSKSSALASMTVPFPACAAAPHSAAVESLRSDHSGSQCHANRTEQLSGTCGRRQPDETWRPRPGPAAPTLPPNHRSPSIHSTRRLDSIARPRFFPSPSVAGAFPPSLFPPRPRESALPGPSHDPSLPPSAAPRHAATRWAMAVAGSLGPIYSHRAEVRPLRARHVGTARLAS